VATIPKSAVDMAAVIGDLQRRLSALETARPLESAVIGKGGIRIEDGGSITVLDQTSAATVFYVGRLGFASPPAGGAVDQMVTTLARQDGGAALQLADLNTTPGHTFRQALQWFDPAGNVVVADDTLGSGVGLARPHLNLGPLANLDLNTWPKTSAGAWTTISECFVERQNPQLTWAIYLYAAAATTVQFRFMLNGSQIGTTQTVSNNTFSLWNDTKPIDGSIAFGTAPLLELQAQVTAGAGAGYAQQLLLQGAGS